MSLGEEITAAQAGKVLNDFGQVVRWNGGKVTTHKLDIDGDLLSWDKVTKSWFRENDVHHVHILIDDWHHLDEGEWKYE